MSLLLRTSRHTLRTRDAGLTYSPMIWRKHPILHQPRRTLFGVGVPITYASISACKTLVWGVIGLNGAVFAAWQWASGGRTVPFSAPTVQLRMEKALNRNFLLKQSDVPDGKWWTSITSAFSHKGFYHILANMITLHAFSTVLIYSAVPPAALGALMFGSAVSGSLAFLSNERMMASQGGLRQYNTAALGASGVVMGLGAAAAMLAPTVKMMLFGVVPVPMWALFAGYTFYDVYYVGDARSKTGHAAHLGGGAFGAAFYILVLRRLGGIAAF